MARPGRPERNRAARSFRQLRRFHQVINSDKVFGTHSKKYWYFDTPKPEGGAQDRRYVGPVDDPEITKRVEAFKDLKADLKGRRRLVSTLTREASLPRPLSMAGQVVEELAKAGFFRLRGVLVGTVAYQCYSALLGRRLDAVAMQTGDADFAQFPRNLGGYQGFHATHPGG